MIGSLGERKRSCIAALYNPQSDAYPSRNAADKETRDTFMFADRKSVV